AKKRDLLNLFSLLYHPNKCSSPNIDQVILSESTAATTKKYHTCFGGTMRRKGTTCLLAILLLSCITIVCAADYSVNLEDKAIKKIPPVYPPLAKIRRIQGKVSVGVQVDSDGKVTEVEFLEGNVLFKLASLEAAKQWGFQKSSNGMTGHIVFRFYLSE
ncbi:MAG: energy transducer TonB, partial [Acidobacteriota bacterium]